MKYLVDSDWLIDAIAGVVDASDYLQRLASDGVGVSIITRGEIYEGAHNAPDPSLRVAEFRQFLDGFVVLPLTDAIEHLQGDLNAGSTITMTCTFRSGGTVTTTFPVIDPADRPEASR